MSLNADLASLAESTRQRLSRLSASAGERLFSPRLSRAAGTRPSVAFASPLPGGVDARPSLSLDAGVGASGEFSFSSGVSGGGTGDLSVFVLSPELKSSLCLGTVARGLKFCTRGAGVCPVVGHNKKVDVVEHDLYISTGRNSAFSNHHVPSNVLTRTQLQTILQERHTEEEWVRLLFAWNSKAIEDSLVDSSSDTPFSKVGALMVATAVTPSRKRKPIYGLSGTTIDEEVPGLTASSSSLSSPGSSDSDFELLPIPIVEMQPEDKMADMLVKWDTVVSNVNAMSGIFKKLRSSFGDDIESVQDRVSVVDSKIGTRPKIEAFGDCMTTWEGLSYVQHEVSDLSISMADCYAQIGGCADGNQN